jgi:hypothetical protein
MLSFTNTEWCRRYLNMGNLWYRNESSAAVLGINLFQCILEYPKFQMCWLGNEPRLPQ